MRRTLATGLLIACVLNLGVHSAKAAELSLVSGSIVTTDGYPIPKATLEFINDSNRQQAVASADSKGKFAAQLPLGKYGVYLSSSESCLRSSFQVELSGPSLLMNISAPKSKKFEFKAVGQDGIAIPGVSMNLGRVQLAQVSNPQVGNPIFYCQGDNFRVTGIGSENSISWTGFEIDESIPDYGATANYTYSNALSQKITTRLPSVGFQTGKFEVLFDDLPRFTFLKSSLKIVNSRATVSGEFWMPNWAANIDLEKNLRVMVRNNADGKWGRWIGLRTIKAKPGQKIDVSFNAKPWRGLSMEFTITGEDFALVATPLRFKIPK